MPQIQIKQIGNSAALLLSEEMMQLLGARLGDEVNVSLEKRRLIMRHTGETERERKIEKVTRNVFDRRKNVFRQLAKGVS